MDSIFVELLKQAPSAAALVVVAYIFLRAEVQREERRIAADQAMEIKRVASATALEHERQQHEREINNMWATFLKKLTVDQQENLKQIIEELGRHEGLSQKRYERLKITRDLKNAAKRKEP